MARRWSSSMADDLPAAGWMHAEGDPPGTVRYWNGTSWQGDPQPVAPPATTPTGREPVPGPPQASSSDGWSGKKKTAVVMTIVVLLLAGVGLWSFTAARAQAEVANDFMSALAANDYDTAAGLLSDGCGQPESRTAAALERDFSGFDIIDFELEVGTVGLSNSDQTGAMVGTVTMADGRVLPIELAMLKRGDWGVCLFGGS